MAFTITHIIIADMVSEYAPKIVDYPTYILGTIAPDAVHVNQNYSAKLKERSHLFTPNLVWGKIDTWEKAEEWMQSIRDYYNVNRGKYNHDFLWGYIVHLLVDVYNSMFFYTPFIQSIKEGYEETIKKYKDESFGMSYYLFSEYSASKNLREILQSGKAITMEGVIEQEDIVKRIEYLFEEEFKRRDVCVCEYSICTIKGTEKFIHGATKFVKDKISSLLFEAK